MIINPDKMNEAELLSFMEGYIRRLGDIIPADENEKSWITLQRRLYKEIKIPKPIYKVSNIHPAQTSHEGVMEYNVMYFSSLGAAKRELKKRFGKLMRSSDRVFIAQPEEIIDANLSESVAPSIIQSIITNQDLNKRAPGRFKFYEVRICKEKRIVPVQLILTQVNIVPTKQPKEKMGCNVGITVPFPSKRKFKS